MCSAPSMRACRIAWQSNSFEGIALKLDCRATAATQIVDTAIVIDQLERTLMNASCSCAADGSIVRRSSQGKRGLAERGILAMGIGRSSAKAMTPMIAYPLRSRTTGRSDAHASTERSRKRPCLQLIPHQMMNQMKMQWWTRMTSIASSMRTRTNSLSSYRSRCTEWQCQLG